MVGVKVLDLSGTRIKALPGSISNLVNLFALRLRKCQSLKYLPSLAKLRALKKLDLHEAGIEVVPQGMEMLVNLEYLDLFCSKLKEIPMGILPSLPSLQYSVVYPNSAITKRINLEEVARLSKLQSLECGIEVIQDFNYLANKSKDFESLTTYNLRLTSGMRKLFPLELLHALQNLEKIEVRECKQMGEIIASSNSDASPDKFTFPKLRELILSCLDQLKNICSAKRVMGCDSIKDVQIIECPKLKRIPLRLPLLDNGQQSPPPCLKKIEIDYYLREWWESVVELDHPNAKNILQPFLKFIPYLLHNGNKAKNASDVGSLCIVEEMRLRCIHPSPSALLSYLINSNYDLFSSKGNFSRQNNKAKENRIGLTHCQ
ncbi:hypothetical protein SLEP1_g51903 [Rubroshorea leprosula]|uniref:Disease resistance protein At4g27190-like leucine-rich repeats domain-containing protein n=1 Tax=Rubroshorea leprosula TaxID=152421 RepID=A0AAV5M6A1_9ROSI|nr:hypothetical protein SLEP1_g51903 [Rubroshorea leprosula]